MEFANTLGGYSSTDSAAFQPSGATLLKMISHQIQISLGGSLALKLLLDEMYTGLKEYFEILGWDVLTVHDAGLKGAGDKKIIEYAEKNGLLIVTQDQKPADLAELKGVPYVMISKKMITRMADAKIREKYPELFK